MEEGELIGYKLPGSLIYENEDLDDAAYRILNDSTGLKRVQLKQFRCFGSPARTSNRLDVMWLEATSKVELRTVDHGRFISPCARIAGRRVRPINPSRSVGALSTSFLACHSIIKRLSRLPVQEIRNWVPKEPAIIFDYMPMKFTAFQLRAHVRGDL